MNLADTIIPKSDQLNADDLISGPRTITITKVIVHVTGEQPVAIHYEGDNGRPYKPGKSMRRVLAMLWGMDGNAFIGRRLTLYRDPNVKWGGEPVGGIRISHASDIPEAVSLSLTETRGRRKPFRVEPLPEAADAATIAAGDAKARDGSAAFRAWWKTLPAADKTSLRAKAEGEWKTIAATADQGAK